MSEEFPFSSRPASGPNGEGSLILHEAGTPGDIEAASFALIDQECPEPRPFQGDAWTVARRIIHASGDTGILNSLIVPNGAVEAGLAALSSGAAVYTDTEMVRAGIPMRRLEPLGSMVECVLAQKGLAAFAEKSKTTRTRAGFQMLGDKLGGAIAVIGNAPTALIAILEHVKRGASPPALIVAMPVGFINAAESKELLLRYGGLNCITLRGRRGGSPLAAAAINALAGILAERSGRKDTMRWTQKDVYRTESNKK